jgi:hypothetical protein
MNIDRASLRTLLKSYRLGEEEAEATLRDLAENGLDVVNTAFHPESERAPERAHVAFTEAKEAGKDLAAMLANEIERAEKNARAAERGDRCVLHVLDPSDLTTETVLAACDTTALHVAVPMDPTEVFAVDRRALAALAKDLSRKGRRDVRWHVSGEAYRWFVVAQWTTNLSRGEIRFSLAPIHRIDLLRYTDDVTEDFVRPFLASAENRKAA